MVSLTTGDNTMIDSILAKFEGAYAPNTIRSYRSRFQNSSAAADRVLLRTV